MVALFAVTPQLVRSLGESSYGIYLLLATLTGLMGLASFGIGDATLRYVAFYAGKDDWAGVNRVCRSSVVFAIISAGFVACLAFVFAPGVVSLFGITGLAGGEASVLVRVSAVALFVRLVSSPFLCIPQALLRFDLSAKVMILESLLRVLACWWVVSCQLGLKALVVLNLVLACVTLAAAGLAAFSCAPRLRLVREYTFGFNEILSFGVVVFVTQIVGMGYQYADRILLSKFLGPSAVPIFSIPQDLVLRTLTLIGGSPAAALMPTIAGMTDTFQVRKLLLRSIAVFLMSSIIVFVPVAIYIGDFLRLWISPGFADKSHHLAFLLCASSLCRGSFVPVESYFRAIGRPKYVLVMTLLGSITVIALDIVLIPRFGLMGAGYAFCITPIWGYMGVAFALTSFGKPLPTREAIQGILIPLSIGGLCLCVGVFLRGCLPIHVGWLSLFGFSGMTFVFTFTVIFFYVKVFALDLVRGRESGI